MVLGFRPGLYSDSSADDIYVLSNGITSKVWITNKLAGISIDKYKKARRDKGRRLYSANDLEEIGRKINQMGTKAIRHISSENEY